MSAESLELIPHTNQDAAREQFERLGHVGFSGLYDQAVAARAIDDAKNRSLRTHRPPVPGQEIANLRGYSKKSQPDLHAVVASVQEGAAILGRNIMPTARRERTQIQIIHMLRGNIRGPLHRDRGTLLDVVAIANLEGSSHLWIEGDDDGDGFDYAIGAGDVVIHDLDRKLLHQGYTGPNERRVGLAIAKH